MPDTAHPTKDIQSMLAAIVGDEYVITEEAERSVYSNDIFFWDESETADVVVQPGSPDEVARLVTAAADLNLYISIRGGGMSYTKGYVPAEQGCMLMDLRRLNRIREINVTDRYVVVDAGCTWISVADALKEHGLKLDFPAPFSGLYSTVGGAMSQNVPSTMKGVLGLEVVRADGAKVRTGSWGRVSPDTPFFRDYGPDLTGLFLGDTGSFGIKTGVSLHISKKVGVTAHGSFAFETYEDMAETMIELGPYDFVTRRVGLDPFKSQNAAKVGFKEAIKTLGDVTTTGSSLVSGLMDSMKMATAGTNFMDGVKWSLHLTVEGLTQDAAEAGLQIVRDICLKRSREIANIMPRAMEARGFSVRGFLGKDGQRWVPTNSLWPLSRAVEVATAVQDFFNSRRAEMDQHGMWESYMTNYGQGYFMCEPSFYWVDEVSEHHLRHLPAEEAKKFKFIPANPHARAYAQKLRFELRDFFHDLGAVHVQLAKFYRYQDALAPETARLLSDLKGVLDPDRRFNRANLGL
ncbi:MAG: FAD-binding oxidoreductase [Rhodospirillaceae bacterium]